MDDFNPERAADALTGTLRELGTPERAAQEKRYLKSSLEFFGVTVPVMRRAVVAAAREHPGLAVAGTVAWAVALWQEPVHERRMACVELLTLAAPRMPAADLAVVERLLREISRRDPAWAAAFTEAHISEMSGATFREAVRRLPPDDAERLRQLRLASAAFT